MYEERGQDAPTARFTTDISGLTIQTDGLDKMYRNFGLRNHPVSLLTNLSVKSSVGRRIRRDKHESRIGVSINPYPTAFP